MDTDADDVELTLDLEPEPDPDPPVPGVAGDSAAEAFARLEGELALMRRAVQHLAAERADIVIPDYGATLTDMTKRMGAISKSLRGIAGHPAMQMTPDSIGSRIAAAAEAARRSDQDRINQARRLAPRHPGNAQRHGPCAHRRRAAPAAPPSGGRGFAGGYPAMVFPSRHYCPSHARKLALAIAHGGADGGRSLTLGCRRTADAKRQPRGMECTAAGGRHPARQPRCH